MERIELFCFAASYGVALALELWHQVSPRPILRVLTFLFAFAGWVAHLAFIVVQALPFDTPMGSLLFLGLILGFFYLYGSVHHYRRVWGLFVLPLVLGLVILAAAIPSGPSIERSLWSGFTGERVWGTIHGVLLLAAGVGVCIAFLGSVMYLVQVHRLRAKLPPGQGMKMMSLERLESMNRWGILLAFPLLTAGLGVGIALQMHRGTFLQGWDSPKILSVLGLWLVFAILLYLRYGVHARGRQVAWLTMVAFAILIIALLSPVHPFVQGGGP